MSELELFRNKTLDNNILSTNYSKISVIDEITGKKYAVITHQEVITAQGVLVKLTPSKN